MLSECPNRDGGMETPPFLKLKPREMSEDRTPIEELIDCYKVAAHYKTWETFLQQLPSVLNVLLEKDKTHREKYKHTKEDVIKAMVYGAENEHHFYLSNKAEAEQYYNETHKNQD